MPLQTVLHLEDDFLVPLTGRNGALFPAATSRVTSCKRGRAGHPERTGSTSPGRPAPRSSTPARPHDGLGDAAAHRARDRRGAQPLARHEDRAASARYARAGDRQCAHRAEARRDAVRYDVGGLGGCPFAGQPKAAGNICTEELVLLCEEMGIDTGVDLDALIEVGRMAEEIVGHTLPSEWCTPAASTRPPPGRGVKPAAATGADAGPGSSGYPGRPARRSKDRSAARHGPRCAKLWHSSGRLR